MWFKFPKGAESISCQQQNFTVEAEDSNGKYFRAPNHFAPFILAISGFSIVDQPEGGPEDLPLLDPLRDGTITNMSVEIEGYKQEVANLRSDLNQTVATLRATISERDDLKARLIKADAKVEELQNKLDDLPIPPVETKPVEAKK